MTELRSKPALPFGGEYRVVDLVLSKFLGSDIVAMYVLARYRSRLDRVLAEGLEDLGRSKEQFITVVPPKMNARGGWYEGTVLTIVSHLVTGLIADLQTPPLDNAVWNNSGVAMPARREGTKFCEIFIGTRLYTVTQDEQQILPVGQVLMHGPVACLEKEDGNASCRKPGRSAVARWGGPRTPQHGRTESSVAERSGVRRHASSGRDRDRPSCSGWRLEEGTWATARSIERCWNTYAERKERNDGTKAAGGDI